MTSPMPSQDRPLAPIPPPIDSLHQRIAHATTEIRDCKQRLVNLLCDRATASAACADFETALRDTDEMRVLMPSSPLVYLCQGDIYRQQGRQSAAIKVYCIGLALSATSSDRDPRIFERLQDNIKAAAYDCNKTIDFVTQLPEDIVTCFIIPMIMGDDRLHQQEKCPYLYVSRSWRERIVGVHGGLKFSVGCQNKEIGELKAFALYVGSLEIEHYHSETDSSNVFDHLDFCSLTRLDIKDYHVKGRDQRFHVLDSDGFRKLTYLRIQHLHGAVVRMADILSGCPLLEELVMRYASSIDFTCILQQLRRSLKVLRIHVAGKEIDQPKVLSLLHQLPRLQYLDIVPWKGSTAMTDLQQHCPSLKCLQYASKCYYNPWRDLPMEDSTRPGLQCLQIHDPEGQYYDTEQLNNMLKNNHETLRVLDLCLGNPSTEMNLSFPALRRIVIQSQYALDSCYGWWILDHAPNLDELKVDMLNVHKFPSLIPMLLRIKNLRSIQFHVGDPFSSGYNHDMLYRFFEQQAHHLRSLDIYVNPAMLENARWVSSIHSMSQLRYLEMNLHDEIGVCFEPFMKGLSKGCRLLQQLHLHCALGVTDKEIIHLLQLEMLQAITTPIADMSRMAILSLASLENLKVLNIIHGAEGDMDAVKILATTRSDIKVSMCRPYIE